MSGGRWIVVRPCGTRWTVSFKTEEAAYRRVVTATRMTRQRSHYKHNRRCLAEAGWVVKENP